MQLKFTLQRRQGARVDLSATFDSSTTVGELADFLVTNDPVEASRAGAPFTLTLADRPGGTLDPDAPLAEADVRSGATLSVVPAAGTYDMSRRDEHAALITIVSGPGAGREFPLGRGAFVVGRDEDCHVVLPDPLVSRRHARVNITDIVEVLDLGSANGTMVGGAVTPRALLRASDQVQVGDTILQIALRHQPAATPSVDTGSSVSFVRSPVLTPVYEGGSFEAPTPPERQPPQRLPLITLFVPLLMAPVLYAITHSWASLAFIALSPLMLVGSNLESRRNNKRDYREAVEAFDADVALLSQELATEAAREVAARTAEAPSAADLVAAALRRTPMLWSRRHDTGTFGELRLGTARLPSRIVVEVPKGGRASRDLKLKARGVADEVARVGPVPVIARLADSALGVAGARRAALANARSLVLQAVTLHSPSELVVTSFVSLEYAEGWDWLKWVPHTSSPHSPVRGPHLAATQSVGISLVTALESLVAERDDSFSPSSAQPAVLVIVDSEPPVEHSRLVELAELGPARGIYVLWVVPDAALLPACCKTFVSAEVNATEAIVGSVSENLAVLPVDLDVVSGDDAERVGRALAPVADLGARGIDDSDIPKSVSQLALLGRALGQQADAVIERWGESNSILTGPYAPEHLPKRVGHLRAVVGQSATGPHALDLRSDGPHALVGGTTGSGKSELLQSWILAMAAAHSPQRLNFLFVDYKGGSAFAECAQLPHSIGVVTDLKPHLVRRALKSLTAEVRLREELLAEHEAKDLAALEAMGSTAAPPSLVIVVDEFAALVQEVPEFVDGVVNIAQRGRSLGLHLVLATQRPAGVIRDNLRANTNLRIALRMADADDSTDVLGAPDAASFDQDVPGRAMSKSGARRLVPFQAAYSGGRTSDEPEGPEIALEELSLTSSAPWVAEAKSAGQPPSQVVGTDISRLVSTVGAAFERARLPVPRKAWLPGLGTLINLRDLPVSATDDELVLGLCDLPDSQSQPAVAFRPDREGNLVVYGTSGSGKSTVLRSLAVAIGYAAPQTPSRVYGLDFGSLNLAMLEELPHVGSIVPGSDHERVTRVLRMLRQTIDERATTFSRAKAPTLTDFRRRPGNESEPRYVLLVDGLPAFRQAYETHDRLRWLDMFNSILSEGRAVGVHVVMTSDQRSGLSSAMASSVQRRLVLRMASVEDYSMLGVPTDVLVADSVPGRALDGEREIQLAVPGPSAELTQQADAIAEFAGVLRRAGVAEAPAITRLPELIPLSGLAPRSSGVPLGVESESLDVLEIEPSGGFLVTGPAISGRTTTLLTLLRASSVARPGQGMHLLGQRRSPLVGAFDWSTSCLGVDEVTAWASELGMSLASLDLAEPRQVIVLEAAGDHVNGMAEMALQALVKAALADGHWVIAEGESNSLMSGMGFLGLVKASRTGVVLQPDQESGSLLRTPFPRASRADFPLGRGFFVRAGRYAIVQVAVPWEVADDGELSPST